MLLCANKNVASMEQWAVSMARPTNYKRIWRPILSLTLEFELETILLLPSTIETTRFGCACVCAMCTLYILLLLLLSLNYAIRLLGREVNAVWVCVYVSVCLSRLYLWMRTIKSWVEWVKWCAWDRRKLRIVLFCFVQFSAGVFRLHLCAIFVVELGDMEWAVCTVHVWVWERIVWSLVEASGNGKQSIYISQ